MSPKTRVHEKTHQQPPVHAVRFAQLVKAGHLSMEQLTAAILAAQKNGEDPATFISRQLEIPKSEVGAALAAYYRCPFIEFKEQMPVPAELVAKISPKFLKANCWVPIGLDGNTVYILIDDPHSQRRFQDIQIVYPGRNLRFHVGFPEDIIRFIDTIGKERAGEAGEAAVTIESILSDATIALKEKIEEPVSEESAEDIDSAVPRLVSRIISDGFKAGASDIHIEPYAGKDLVIRFRVDGECSIYSRVPQQFRRALVSRIKIMAGLDIAESRRPQDGKMRFRISEQEEIELRIATLPTSGGNEDVVMRILASSKPLPLEHLNMDPLILARMQTILDKPYGLFLVVGPTGSGKTTTLHSALSYLNGPDMKIWTAEDPIEITQYGLRQVQIQPKIGLTFAAAMRAFLRADPDIIMVGEMRDSETIEISIKAALTGHLVLSTMHTNSAPETISRLLDMGVDPFNYSEALLGVLAQRLIKTICSQCRQPYHASLDEYDALASAYGRQAWSALAGPYTEAFTLFRGRGCDNCAGSGYKGRTGIHELLVPSEKIRSLIQRRAPVSEIAQCAAKDGMTTLVQDGVLKCLRGFTDLRQVQGAALH